VRFRVDPVASGGADWPDEAQLLGRRVDSGLDRTRRARVPDARRVAFGTAHASRAAAARATARARERGDALGLPSLGTAGADEGRWEAIHGDASAKRAGDVGASSSPAIGMSLESFKTLIVQAGLTGDGRERNDRGARRSASRRPFTAAAAEAAFATARAGDFRVRELSWGAFLDALALVASATGRTLGDVALRVREVNQPLCFEGRAPPVPRVTYVPEPPRVARTREDRNRFDVDAFARACDEAHVSMRTSSAHRRGAAHSVEEEEEERRRREHREEEASRRATDDDDDDDDDDGKRRDETDAPCGTSAEVFFSEPSVVAPSSPEGLASTWRQHTSKLDLGTSLVASLRASEYYRRARG
jgi:hypothetical protein